MYTEAHGYRGVHRHSNPLPASGSSAPLFSSRRKGGEEWEKKALVALVALSVVLFVVVLYQGNRQSLLALDKEQSNRDVEHLKTEATSLRASLNNQQQEKEMLQRQLREALGTTDRIQENLKRSQDLRESLQTEMRDMNARLRRCENDAKKREEELEADIAKVTQERNDLKIRVDTDDAMAVTWARKLAEEQMETKKCQEKLALLSPKTAAAAGSQGETSQNHAEVDLGRKVAAGEDQNGTREEGMEGIGTIDTPKDVQRNRRDLEH